jgi:glycerophosphoryl diester phosphodiesterase
MRLLRFRPSWKVLSLVFLMSTLPLATPQGRRVAFFAKCQFLNTIEWMTIATGLERKISLDPLKPCRIAHAGGGQDGQAYLNDKEALEASFARGFRIFELDFEWTSDQGLVLIHDWEATWGRFGGYPGKLPTRAAFLQQMTRPNRTGLDLQGLCAWMAIHPEARVITDVKQHNLEALSLIMKLVPKAQQCIIPQAYTFDEWDGLVGMGFDRVILTVYQRGQRSFMLRTFINKRHPWGLTLPKERALRDSIVQFARERGVHVFAHTVNTPEEARRLKDRGVSEIYTDFLPPVEGP